MRLYILRLVKFVSSKHRGGIFFGNVARLGVIFVLVSMFVTSAVRAETADKTDSLYEPEVHGHDEDEGTTVKTVKKAATPKPVVASFNSLQKDLKLTCPLLLKDGQLEVFRSLLEPYVDDNSCKTCRAFSRVWWGLCRIPPVKKVFVKKKTKQQLEDEEAEKDTEAAGEEPTPLPTPRIPTSAATPSTELLEIFSRISRQLADNTGVQEDLKNLFASFEYKAPITARLYITTLTAYFVSAWPESETSESEPKQPEAKKEDLDNLF